MRTASARAGRPRVVVIGPAGAGDVVGLGDQGVDSARQLAERFKTECWVLAGETRASSHASDFLRQDTVG